MFEFKEGMLIPITDKYITNPKYADDKDNPICDAITDFMFEKDYGYRYSAYFCFIDEQIDVYKKGTGERVAKLQTTTMLEDWLRNYFNHRKVSPFTLKVFHQRDHDTDQIEDDRLWVGIAEDGEGVSETDLEKLRGFMSARHVQDAREGMRVKMLSKVCQDYAGECPVTNVLSEMTNHLSLEVGVDGEQAEFYQDNYQDSIVVKLSMQLRDWMTKFHKGINAPVGMIYIDRDDTLPEQPLCVGIDYDITNYKNISDLDLSGIERRLERTHIIEGRRGDCEFCAVALVLSELFPKYAINVNGEEAVIHSNGVEKAIFLISEPIAEWIDAYDNENDVGGILLIIRKCDVKGYDYLLDIKQLTERQKDLQNRISKLSELSSEITLHAEKLTDNPDDIDILENEYQQLFSQTINEFGT